MGLERRDFNPNSARPINPLVKGRGGLPFTSNSPPLSKEEYPTPEDINRARTIEGELKEQKGAVSVPVAFGMTGSALVVGGVGGFFLAKEVFANPPTSIGIDSFPNGFNTRDSPQLQGLPPQLEQQSDNKVENPEDLKETLKKIFAKVEIIEVPGVISEKDIVRLPQEEIDRQYPDAFAKLGKEEDKIIISLPQPIPSREMAERVGSLRDLAFEVGEDKNTLQFQYPLDLRFSSNPNARIKYTKSYGGFAQADRNALQGEEYYDTYTFYNVPKGTIITAPVDGLLVISTTNGQTKSPDGSGEGFIDFQAPNGNIYRLAIVGQKGNSIFVLKPLLDAPELPAGFNRKPIGSGAPVKKGQKILQANAELDDLVLKIFIGQKAELGKRPKPLETPFVPTNIEFFMSPDNKLIASEE